MLQKKSRRLRAVAATALAAILVLSGCTQDAETVDFTGPDQVDQPLPDDTVAQMTAAVQNAMTVTGSSGAIVGVWVPWSGTWVTGMGTQSVDDPTPVDVNMSFRIGNVTRMMTCDVLYGMAADGTVALDAPVPEYVAGVADMADITLLDLCNGTSGEGSSRSYVKDMALNTPNRIWPPLELAAFGLGEATGTPHTEFRDSDAGYLLLGMALERASGKSAQQLIAEYVTEPLALANTELPGDAPAAPAGTPLRGNVSPTVDGAVNCAVQTDYTTMSASLGYTDSGAVSTITDLGRYMQANVAGALPDGGADPGRYGAPLPQSAKAPTWYQATGGAYMVGSMIGTYGGMPGYISAAYADPATGFTVAVVLNNSAAGNDKAAYLAWELAALASKAPVAEGQTAPDFALPFTAEQYHEVLVAGNICG